MIPVYICEDNPSYRERLHRLISNQILMEDYDMEIALSTHSPNEVLSALCEHDPFAIYFLDIHLGDCMSGLELAVEIRKRNSASSIIFITTHDEMCYLTFQYKIEAMDYILKDKTEDLSKRIRECLAYAVKKIELAPPCAKPSLCIKIRDKDYYISFDDIYYIETSTKNHRLILYKKDGSMEFYGNLDSIYEQTGDSFLRSHRSYLINKSYIAEIQKKKHQILLTNGIVCKIGKVFDVDKI